MEALFASAVAGNSKARAQDVCGELLSILQQYPSGLTPAVIATQLQSALQQGRERRRGPKRRATTQANPDAADVARSRQDQRPAWWTARSGNLNPTPLADCLDDRRRRAMVYAAIAPCAAEGSRPASASGAAPALAAPSLLLSDGSTADPVGMFVHSSHLPLVGGPIFEEGSRVRASAIVSPPPPGCRGLPPIMPTTQLVVELPAAAWQRLGDIVPCSSGGGSSGSAWAGGAAARPVRGLQQVLTEHTQAVADLHAGPVPLEGWLVVRVVSVGAAEHGGAWGCHTVRSVLVCADEAAGTEPQAPVPLVLRDEEAHLADLVLPGEVLAVLGAALQPLEAPPPPTAATQAAGAAAHAGPAVAVLLSDWSLVVAPMEGQETAAKLAANSEQTKQQQQQQYAVLPDLASLASGGEALVWGRVQDLRLIGTWQLECTLCAAGGGPGSVAVRMQLAGKQRSKALLHQLREGHTLLLVGAKSISSSEQLGGQQQQQQQAGDAAAAQPQATVVLEWDESWPGAAAQDLSVLPALLTTPALQRGLEAGLQDLTAPNAAPPWPLAVVEGTVAGAEVSTVRVHAACGRPVSRVSLGLGGLDELLFDGTDGGGEWGQGGGGGGGAAGEADDGEAIEEGDGEGCDGGAAGALWGCCFCGVECGPSETELVFGGSLRVEAPPGSGGDGAVALAAEAGVFRTLLPFSPEQWRRLPAHAAASQVQRATVGRPCRLCVCAVGSGEDAVGSPARKLTITQVKLL